MKTPDGKYIVTCPECNGSGVIDCYECHGTQETECPTCGGDMDCDECGDGTEECGMCEGEGEIETSDTSRLDPLTYLEATRDENT